MDNPPSSAPDSRPTPAGPPPKYDPQRIQKSLACLEQGQEVTASPLLGFVKRHPFWVAGGFLLAGILLQGCMSLAMQCFSNDNLSWKIQTCNKCDASKEIYNRPTSFHVFWICFTPVHGGDNNCAHEWQASPLHSMFFWGPRNLIEEFMVVFGDMQDMYLILLQISWLFFVMVGVIFCYGIFSGALTRARRGG